jgi:hypothetical protein
VVAPLPERGKGAGRRGSGVVAWPSFSSLRGESSLDEVSAQMMTLLFVLYVLTGIVAVVALLALAFGPFVLPERLVTPLASNLAVMSGTHGGTWPGRKPRTVSEQRSHCSRRTLRLRCDKRLEFPWDP